MEEAAQYIDMMVASLQKKIGLLDSIIEMNKKVAVLAGKADMDFEELRSLLDERETVVNEINQMDSGFQTVFDKVKEALDKDKARYRQQILSMQNDIRQITERIVQIEKLESQNRLLMDGQFAKMRSDVQKAKKGVNVAQNYYKSMSKTMVTDAQFLDKKN